MTCVCCAVLTGQKAALAREIARRKEGAHLCLSIFLTSLLPFVMLFCLLLVCSTPLAWQRLAAPGSAWQSLPMYTLPSACPAMTLPALP